MPNMELKLGLTSYAFYWASKKSTQQTSYDVVVNVLEKTSLMGLDVFQICENLPLQNWDTNDLKRLGAAARQQGIILEAGTRGLDEDNLRTYIKVANILGSHVLRLTPWSGSVTRQVFPIDRLFEVIYNLLPLCIEYDVTLALENYFDISDQDLASFVQQVNDVHVGICLDTANSVGLLQLPQKTVEVLHPYVVSLHLKDFIVCKNTMGYAISGVPLGQGWLNTEEILAVINQSGRRPNILLELWMDPAENYEATIKKEEMWVQQSVAYARHSLNIGDDHK